MVRRICLDSDILISFLNKDVRTKEILDSLDADFSTTAINSFELWFGRKKNETVFELLSWLKPIELDDKSARMAADMLRKLKKKGKVIDLKDVLIGAVCIKNDMELLTNNKKHFERLKEFGLILV